MDLLFSSVTFDVYDASGEVAKTYACIHTNSAQPCAVGMKCSGAQEDYIFKDKGDFITVVVSKYTSNGNGEQKATFKLKVSGTSSADNTSTFSTDIKTYKEFPYAPDFGAMLGINYDVVNNENNLSSYAYKVSSVQKVDSDGSSGADYIKLLEKCGYKDKGTLSVDGVTFHRYENSNYKTTVQFGVNENLGYIVVVVFK